MCKCVMLKHAWPSPVFPKFPLICEDSGFSDCNAQHTRNLDNRNQSEP